MFSSLNIFKRHTTFSLPGYETLGRISAQYSMPTMRPGRNVEHVYSEIGPPVLPPRGYLDDGMTEGETLLDENSDLVNAPPLATV